MEEKPLIQELSVPLYQARGWMKLLGVVMIVQGVLSALSLVGLIIAWLPIWLGVLLFKAAGLIEGAQLSGDKMQMLESLRRLRTYFVINGVLMLIALIFAGVMILMFGAGIFAMFSESGGMQGW